MPRLLIATHSHCMAQQGNVACHTTQAQQKVASILNTTCRQDIGHASKVVSVTHPFLLNLASLLMSALHVHCCLTVVPLWLHLYQELLSLLQIMSAVKKSIISCSHPTQLPTNHAPPLSPRSFATSPSDFAHCCLDCHPVMASHNYSRGGALPT